MYEPKPKYRIDQKGFCVDKEIVVDDDDADCRFVDLYSSHRHMFKSFSQYIYLIFFFKNINSVCTTCG